MTTEPQRLQYLDAMGLTAWVSRYRLPHARPSEACDWELPAVEDAPRAPRERLQALLDDAPADSPAQAAAPDAAVSRPAAGSSRARALLGGLVPDEKHAPVAPPAEPASSAPSTRGEPEPEVLRFGLSVACVQGRWLVLLPGEQGPGDIEYRLLGNLLRAAGIAIEDGLSVEPFRWPPVEGLPVAQPLEEAREGVQAFLHGRRQRGWQPRRLLVFGSDAALDKVLALEAAQCSWLELPAWQGPDLMTLARDAAAKRALLPQLLGWRDAWREEARDD